MEMKLNQNLVFDPGGYSGHPRGCLFPGGRRALLHGRVRLGRCDGTRSLSVFVVQRTAVSFSKKRASSLVRRTFIAVNRYFPKARKTIGSCEPAK